MNKRGLGKAREEQAAAWLRDAGYTILEHNFNCRFGEIDIVALDAGTLVFVEVKYRRKRDSGFPEEAVTDWKKYRISKTADYYCLMHQVPDTTDCRFDVCAIDEDGVRLYRNAFPYCGKNY